MAKKNFKITTLLGSGSKLVGDFEVPGTVRIDGEVQGTVTVENTLIVGETAVIRGEVKAATVIIGGQVNGDVIAPEGAELLKGARVIGDITTNKIVIDEEAVFQGRCNMNQEVPEEAKRPKKKPLGKKNSNPVKRSAAAALAEALKEVKEQELEEESKEPGKEAASQEKTEVTAVSQDNQA